MRWVRGAVLLASLLVSASCFAWPNLHPSAEPTPSESGGSLVSPSPSPSGSSAPSPTPVQGPNFASVRVSRSPAVGCVNSVSFTVTLVDVPPGTSFHVDVFGPGIDGQGFDGQTPGSATGTYTVSGVGVWGVKAVHAGFGIVIPLNGTATVEQSGQC